VTGRKNFFFAKKKQKTFAIWRRAWGNSAPKKQKFFGSFLQKRTPSLLSHCAFCPC
jgi:hypothetical protein